VFPAPWTGTVPRRAGNAQRKPGIGGRGGWLVQAGAGVVVRLQVRVGLPAAVPLERGARRDPDVGHKAASRDGRGGRRVPTAAGTTAGSAGDRQLRDLPVAPEPPVTSGTTLSALTRPAYGSTGDRARQGARSRSAPGDRSVSLR